MNYNFKNIGLIIFLLITISGIFIYFNLQKQLIMLYLLGGIYIYYSVYYSSGNEFINNIKKLFLSVKDNNIAEFVVAEKDLLSKGAVQTDKFEENKNLETQVIQKLPVSHSLNFIKEKIYEFIKNYIPEDNHLTLVKTDEIPNNKLETKDKIDNLINKYYQMLNILLTVNSEELNYFQQLEKIEKEIKLLIHNNIFINHKSEDAIEKLLTLIDNEFKKLKKDLVETVNNRKSHKYKDYLPTNNEINAANKYEAGILF